MTFLKAERTIIKDLNEILYIFGKEIKALERFGVDYKAVKLYIKLNLIADDFVFVVSFHEQRYPLHYYFK